MGTIQNSMNAMLGTAAAAAAAGKHIKNQAEANIKAEEANQKAEEANELHRAQLDVDRVKAEKAVFNAENTLADNTEAITHQMVLEGNDAGLKPKDGETAAQAEARAVEEYLAAKSDAAENEYQKQMARVKNPAKSKRVAMARKAAIEAQDAQNVRRDLKFDLEASQKQLAVINKALGGIK